MRTVLEVFVTATALMCFIFLIRAVFGPRMSMWLRYALWSLVLVRLPLPFQFLQSPVSVMNAVPEAPALQWGMVSPDKVYAPQKGTALDTAETKKNEATAPAEGPAVFDAGNTAEGPVV